MDIDYITDRVEELRTNRQLGILVGFKVEQRVGTAECESSTVCHAIVVKILSSTTKIVMDRGLTRCLTRTTRNVNSTLRGGDTHKAGWRVDDETTGDYENVATNCHESGIRWYRDTNDGGEPPETGEWQPI